MNFLLRLLTWWNGQTFGTQLQTWRRGQRVGSDAQGNIFYQTRDGKRRWVIFNGESEASRVSPDWHGWLHFTWNEPPTKAPLLHKPWHRPDRSEWRGQLRPPVRITRRGNPSNGA